MEMRTLLNAKYFYLVFTGFPSVHGEHTIESTHGDWYSANSVFGLLQLIVEY